MCTRKQYTGIIINIGFIINKFSCNKFAEQKLSKKQKINVFFGQYLMIDTYNTRFLHS
jgi:hypothetical protein